MGELLIVGTGIMFPGQMTLEAADFIRDADCVFYNVGSHPLATKWLKENSKESYDLYQCYAEGKPRDESYKEMVDFMVSSAEKGNNVVGVFYGHPGVFVGPGFQAIQECREKNIPARMIPGVSAVDCMFSDLEFDPALYGCVMLEASDYVLTNRKIDTTMPLILWQVGVVCVREFSFGKSNNNVDLLKDRLLKDYEPDHPIICYVASTLAGSKPQVQVGSIGSLELLEISASTTCFIKPSDVPGLDRESYEKYMSRLNS